MTRLAFVDTETTGLDPTRHDVWEIALILREDDTFDHQVDVEYVWQVPVDLSTADPTALRINRFYERAQTSTATLPFRGGMPSEMPSTLSFGDPTIITEPTAIARAFAGLTAGAHMVGAVPSFDAAFLDKFLRANGAAPAWHYHLVDVEALAAGYIKEGYSGKPGPYRPPWDSEELSRQVGVEVDHFDRHTALGDARWARAIYDQVMNSG